MRKHRSREIELLREVMEEGDVIQPEPEPQLPPENEDEWEKHLMKARRREDPSRVSQRILREKPTVKPHSTVEQSPSIIQEDRATVGYHPTGNHQEIRAHPWLQGLSRRTLRNIVRTYSPEEILQLITARAWPYRTWAPHYQKRDRAFLSLLYIAAGRITEILSLRKSQFDLEADPQFVVIRRMLTEKVGSKSRRTPFREEFPLPREGPLKPFTELILEYLMDLQEEDEILFPFQRQRGHELVKHITGKWPHWFRAQGERLYADMIAKGRSGVFRMMELLNVAKPETIAQYVKPKWKEYKEEFLKGAP